MPSIVAIPETLDVDALIRNHPPNIPHFTKEKLLQIVSFICKQVYNTSWEVHNGYVQIMSRQFLSVAGDYLQYLEFLQDANVISRDKTYRPSKKHPGNPKSIGYKLVPPHDTAKLKAYSLALLNKGEKRVRREQSITKDKEKQQASERYTILINKYPFIRYLDALEIDMQGAISCLEQLGKTLDKAGLGPHAMELANARYSRCLTALSDLQISPSRTVHIDTTGNRLHSPLTRLKKEFRYFLSYEGQKLVALDLKNSQPFLSLVLMNPDFWRSGDMFSVDGTTKKGKRIL